MAQQPRELDPSRSPRDLFGVQLRMLRERRHLSQQQLADLVLISNGALGHYERGRSLPDRVTTEDLDRVLDTGGLLLACWELAHRFHPGTDATNHANNQGLAARPGAPGDMIGVMGTQSADTVGAAALSAAGFGAWAEHTTAGEVTLASLHLQVRALCADALKQPPAELIERAAPLAGQVYDLARAHQRPGHSRELHLLAAQLNSLMGWICGDLGRPLEAELHASTAMTCAEVAGDPETTAWAYAVRSKNSFWQQHFDRAADYARRGAEYARAGTTAVMLACQLADAASKQGNALVVLEALTNAERASESAGTDTVGGLFSCPPARHANYTCASLLEIGRPAAALAEADRALAAAGTEVGFGTVAQIHVTRARALAACGDVAGAAEASRPVLDLPLERRLATVAGRLVLMCSQFGRTPSPAARSLTEEIRSFCAGPDPAELSQETP